MVSDFNFKRADVSDIDLLTDTRIEVLRAANQLNDSIDMSLVKAQSREYYTDALSAGDHIAYLIFYQKKFIGAGGISFFRVLPTYHNPTGRKAYIMNMYTNPDYRRRGIAYQTLQLLVDEAKKKEIKFISLEATEMGRPLYEKYGFVQLKDEMILNET